MLGVELSSCVAMMLLFNITMDVLLILVFEDWLCNMVVLRGKPEALPCVVYGSCIVRMSMLFCVAYACTVCVLSLHLFVFICPSLIVELVFIVFVSVLLFIRSVVCVLLSHAEVGLEY